MKKFIEYIQFLSEEDAMYRVGVVGAGNMGSGIAQKMAQEGLRVTLVDVDEEAAARGMEIIRETLEEGAARGIFSQGDAKDTLERITPAVKLDSLSDTQLVVEAVYEDLQVKGRLLRNLDGICGAETIFGTNTSSIRVRDIAAYTERPDRVIGMHYFYHPAKNRLLEVIPHAETSAETLEKTLQIGRLHGKTAIIVKDSPGFAVNRFFVPFLNESVRLLEEKMATIPTIEAAAKRAFFIGMGPFELMNVTGIPIAVHAAASLGKELGTFYAAADLLKEQMNTGEPWNLEGEIDESAIPAVIDRLYCTALGVAAELVDQGVASIEDTDRGAKIGLRWRYGPFELINRIGVRKVYENAVALSHRNPAFKVADLLTRFAESGKNFEFKLVDLDVSDGIASITINRPEAMNALNPDVISQLEERIDQAENNSEVRTIVIQGAGKAFVAGADIKFFVNHIRSGTLERIVEFTRMGHQLLLRLENSPKFTIAVVDGLSLGGGSELALACDAIAAAPGGSFGFPETGIGIYPGLGGMIRLARHVGPEIAKYYVFTGKTLSASDAHRLGIVTTITEPINLHHAIEKLASRGKTEKYHPREIPASFREIQVLCREDNAPRLIEGEEISGVETGFAGRTAEIIAAKAPIALRIANELIDAQRSISIADSIELELGRLVEVFSTKDALAGLETPPGKTVVYRGV